jgi:uncharacterized protein involved in exopolysaccharide biosynthesis
LLVGGRRAILDPNMSTDQVEPRHSKEDEISLWEVLAVVLRGRWSIFLTTLLTASAAVAFALLRDPTFTTQASFRPQGSEASASQLMALASQFGVNVPGAGTSEEASPAFYAELLTSREILSRVAARQYHVQGIGTAALADVLEVENGDGDDELRLRRTIEALRDDVLSVQTSRETGIVTIEARTDWPDLSLEIARQLLDEIARFNLDTRQSQAAAERAFIEERVDSAREALTQAESSMQAFLQANRQWENSPDLTFQHDRLDRDISLRQQVYTTLVQSFEQARIAEVRDTPVITVLQAPFLPAPDSRGVALMAAVGLALGGMAGLMLAFVIEAVRRPAPGDPARADLSATWASFVRSLPFVGRRVA